jgi:hypothetical protein
MLKTLRTQSKGWMGRQVKLVLTKELDQCKVDGTARTPGLNCSPNGPAAGWLPFCRGLFAKTASHEQTSIACGNVPEELQSRAYINARLKAASDS